MNTAMPTLTGPIPPGRPEHLAISLWDFSWYTAAGPEDPYGDLRTAFDQAKERGYNAVRICAAPMLLFGPANPEAGPSRDTLDTLGNALEIEGLGKAPDGGFYGRGTRWYDTPGGYRLDLRRRFFDLLDQAQQRGMSVILSSWEYQQSAAFAAERTWHDYLEAFPVSSRLFALAQAFDNLLNSVTQAGFEKTIAFVEIHNEIDFSLLPQSHRLLHEALRYLKERHPDQLITAAYGKPPHLDMSSASPDLEVGQFHIYAYGVLDALQREIDIREEGSAGFPNAQLRDLLQVEAPVPEDYGAPEPWKFDATVITRQMIYGYDWVDPEAWDRWLYNHFGEYRHLMVREITSRLEAIAAWSRRRDVPFLVGESWVGYTPLLSQFEEGPIGRELAEIGMNRAFELGAWGVVPTSNCAPHHPAWEQTKWQQRVTKPWQ